MNPINTGVSPVFSDASHLDPHFETPGNTPAPTVAGAQRGSRTLSGAKLNIAMPGWREEPDMAGCAVRSATHVHQLARRSRRRTAELGPANGPGNSHIHLFSMAAL
jgi:hypothetical protein